MATTENKTTDKLSTRRRTARGYSRPTPPLFKNELAAQAWQREQARIEDEYLKALEKYPPGSKLYVTTARGIKSRRRAGIAFSEQGRAEIEVIDLTDEELEKVRAGDDTILGTEGEGEEVRPVKLAVQLRSGGSFVTPTGAKSIAEDDGLVVFTSANPSPKDADERDELIESLQAENAQLKATIGKLRKEDRQKTNPAAPTRAASSDFGGSDTPLADKATDKK